MKEFCEGEIVRVKLTKEKVIVLDKPSCYSGHKTYKVRDTRNITRYFFPFELENIPKKKGVKK
jgi:hypothetical protein